MHSGLELAQSHDRTRDSPFPFPLSFNFLQRHATEIAGSAGVTTLAALVYLLMAEPIYTARAQLLIDPGISNVVREQSIDSQSNLDSGRVESEIVVLRSEAVALAVVDRLKLADGPERTPGSMSRFFPGSFVPGWLSRSSPDSEDLQIANAVAQLQKKLSVKRIGVSDA